MAQCEAFGETAAGTAAACGLLRFRLRNTSCRRCSMPDIDVRKGMPSVELTREEFERRFRSRFHDPAFAAVESEIAAVAAVAWDGYLNSRKSPRTRKAGPKFADPTYDLSTDWLHARDAILAAQSRHDDPRETKRVLLI